MRFVFPLLGLVFSSAALWIGGHAKPTAWYCRTGLCRPDDMHPKGEGQTLHEDEIAYRAVVEQELLNPYRWAELAEFETLTGKEQEAQMAWQRVKSVAPGSARVLMRALNADVASGNREDAISTAAKILRLTNNYNEPIFEYLNQFFKLPTAEILTRALPPTCVAERSWIQWLAENGNDNDLSESWHWMLNHGCADDEMAGWYAWTLLRRDCNRADAEWAEYMNIAHTQTRSGGELLWNENFSHAPQPSPFDWTVDNSAEAHVSLRDVLQVWFEGKGNTDFHHVRQFGAIRPGTYVLEIDAEGHSLTTDQGPGFVVRDAEHPERFTTASKMYQGEVTRQTWTTRIVVPQTTQCVAVELVRRPSLKFDNKIEGTLKVYRVSLRRAQ